MLEVAYFNSLQYSYLSLWSQNHVDPFAVSWRDFRNSVVIETGLLHLKPFTNSICHFLMIVECGKVGEIKECAY